MQGGTVKISELARRAGVPLPTVKYYLREKLLMPGVATSATQAEYGDEHVRRVRLVKALTELAGLPMHQVKVVLGVLDEPPAELVDALGTAIGALPPYVDSPPDSEHPLAKAALEQLGQVYDPRFTAVAQLDRALQAVADAGMPMSDERLDVYGRALREMAELDLRLMPRGSTADAVEYATLGTALYEPVILALRRLAHQDLTVRGLGDAVADSPSEATAGQASQRERTRS